MEQKNPGFGRLFRILVNPFMVATFIPMGGSAMDIPTDWADVILTPEQQPIVNGDLRTADTDGDGDQEVVLKYLGGSGWIFEGVSDFRHGTKGDYETFVQWRMEKKVITTGDKWDIFDFNKDGIGDLTIGAPYLKDVYFGPMPYGVSRKIDEMTPDFTIRNVARSDLLGVSPDFDGDTNPDVLCLFGTTIYATAVKSLWPTIYDPSSDPAANAIAIETGIIHSLAYHGNINGDSFADLIVNRSGIGFGVLFGGNSLLDSRIHSIRPPDRIINFSSNKYGGLGDVNGDGFDDLITRHPMAILDGALINSHSVIDTDPLGPDYQPLIPFETPVNYTSIHIADFDGDGIKDIVGLAANSIDLYLSSSYTQWPSFPSRFHDPNIRIVSGKIISGMDTADFNKDGRDDIVFSESWGSVGCVFGFMPLRSPSLTMERASAIGTEVILHLSSQGEPSEMRLSGDIVDSLKGVWMPYKSTYGAMLTSGVGQKTVRVKFRNALGRESDEASAVMELTVPTTDDIVGDNWVDGERKARVFCRLSKTSRLKAEVFNRSGGFVVQLLNDEFGPGVWPVEWDGKNALGQQVASGLYFLVTDSEGKRTRTKILVGRRD